MGFESWLVASAKSSTAWFVLLFLYAGLAVLVVAAVIVLTREDGPGSEIRAGERNASVKDVGRHVAMSPLFLSIGDDSVVLDGVLEDGPSVPVTIELLPPADEWMGLVVVKVIERWIDGSEVVDVDLTKIHQPHGTVRLSCEDTSMRLDVLRLSRELDVVA